MTTFTSAVPDTLFGALMADILTDAPLLAKLTALEQAYEAAYEQDPDPAYLRLVTVEELDATLRRGDHLLALTLTELDAAYLDALRPAFAARGVVDLTLTMPLVQAVMQAAQLRC